MKILSDIALNIILITFPILMYFIYTCYRELKCEKYNSIVLNISLFTSLFLSLKFANTRNLIQVLVFCNIPILLAYLKKEPKVAIILSLITIYYSLSIYKININIMIIKYICYYIIYLLSQKNHLSDNKYINIISVIQGFFISYEYVYNYKLLNINTIFEIFFIILLFYIIPSILIHLFNLTDRITNLFVTVSELEKEKQLKNMVFKITHEVKNPLAVASGYLQMIDTKNIDETNKYLMIIKEEIDRSLNIMNDFMELSKIKITKEIVDINLLLDDIRDCLKILIINKNIKFNYNSNDDEKYIEGDYNRLKQVLINILKNSIEAINKDGIIELNSYEKKKYYYIEVIDNGIRIDEESLSKIKEVFYTTKPNGNGLGVTLSNEIIKAHNGTLNYESIKDNYTKVIIKLPKYIID